MKKWLFGLIALAAGASLAFAGGGGQQTGGTSPYRNRITIDYFHETININGLIQGFTKQKLNELFNMDVNFIAPNVSGEAIFQTRSAAGNLGDMMMISTRHQKDVYQAGLLMDITALIEKRGGNLLKYRNYIELMNRKNGVPAGKIYYIPTGISSYSATEPLPNIDGAMYSLQEGAGAFFRWDVYTAAGSPAINTMEDLLPALKKMQDLKKTSELGKPVYGITLFPDWDDTFMRCATTFVETYGYLMTPGCSSVFTWVGSDALRTQRLDDDNGLYYRNLKFLFNANQMGLVDPDSPSHTWNDVATKTRDGQILMSLWSWSGASQYNTTARGNANPPTGFEFIPIPDADYYVMSYAPASQWGEAIAIGSKAKDPERIMDFINWTASPEGMQFFAFGPQGLAWDIKDGKPYATEFGFKVFDDPQTPVPANYGGGTWQNAIAMHNRGWTSPFHHFDINPQTGMPYNPAMWPDVQAKRLMQIDRIWRQQMSADHELDYLKKHNLFTGKVGTSYVPPDDTVEIQTARATCKMIVRNASWRMAFAPSEGEFNSIWAAMKADLRAAGWEDIVKVDLKLAAEEVAARQETLRSLR